MIVGTLAMLLVQNPISEPESQRTGLHFQATAMPESAGVAGGVNVFRQDGIIHLRIAQAQSSPNLSYWLEAGQFVATPSEGRAEASTSGLCYGDGDGDGLIDELEANQHGEANVLTPGDSGPALILEGGDNYHCVWADTDLDGLQEAFLFDVAGQAKVISWQDGGYVVMDDPDRFPWVAEAVSSGGGIFSDIDLDGDVDLILTSPAGADRLYLNEGGGFTRASSECEPGARPGMSAGASLADLDGDTFPDLFIARLDGPDQLYLNDAGCFRETVSPALAEHAFQSWSGLWTDIDRDGDPDLIVSQYDGPVQVYENRDGELVTSQALLDGEGGSRASGLAALDVDGDGDEDVVVAIWDGLPNQLLVNTSTGPAPTLRLEITTPVGAPLFGARIEADWGDRTTVYELSGASGLRSQSDPLLSLSKMNHDELRSLSVYFGAARIFQRQNIELSAHLNVIWSPPI